MQSGTILHLALLKKLSSHYPLNDYHHRFDIFKKQRTTLCSRKSEKHHCPEVNFQKYEEEKESKMAIQIEGERRKKIESIKKRLSPDINQICADQDITGWNMDNAEEIDYFDKFKCNKLSATNNELHQHLRKESRKPKILTDCFNKVKPKFMKTFRALVNTADTQKENKRDRQTIEIKKKQSNYRAQTKKNRKRIKQKQNILLIEDNFSLCRASSSLEKCHFSMMGQRFNSTVLKRNAVL